MHPLRTRSRSTWCLPLLPVAGSRPAFFHRYFFAPSLLIVSPTRIVKGSKSSIDLILTSLSPGLIWDCGTINTSINGDHTPIFVNKKKRRETHLKKTIEICRSNSYTKDNFSFGIKACLLKSSGNCYNIRNTEGAVGYYTDQGP